LNRPDLTAEAFVADPFRAEPGARMYRTGDLACYRADGNVVFLGRVDHQVKIRGFRIELGEIESVLREHPAVRDAAVLVRDEIPGEKRLVAYVIADAPANDLRRFLRDRLPAFMVPATVVPLEAFPMAPSGKIDRSALMAPDGSRPAVAKAFVAPRDELERRLAEIWSDVLGIRPIGMNDDFFELGGNSLMAVRLFSVIEKELQRKLPLVAVFQGATIETLAGLLRRSPPVGPQSSLVAIRPGGNKIPMFLVHPAGGHVFPYLHLAPFLNPEQPLYGLQAAGLDDGQVPHTRIDDMAAHYIQAMRTVQPNGPYFLGGWSMGGVVAFEMAQQLLAQGQRVGLLAVVDGRIPTADEVFPDDDAEALSLVERYFGVSLASKESLAALPHHEQLALALQQAKNAGLVPAELDISAAGRFVEIIRSNLRATQAYQMRSYPGRIEFFKAREVEADAPADLTMGWRDWAGGVDVHVVPGNHASMMYPPHVEVLAKALTACLDRAQAELGGRSATSERIEH